MYERADRSDRDGLQLSVIGVVVDVGHPLAEGFLLELLLQVLGVVLLGSDHIGVCANDADAAVEDLAVVVDKLVGKVLGGAFDQRIATESDANTGDTLEQGPRRC